MNYNFKECILAGTLHHAFIIEGPYNINKLSAVKNIIKAILCTVEPGKGCGVCAVCRKIDNGNHLDIFHICPDGSEKSKVHSIKDDAIVKLQENLSRRPVECNRNIAVIEGADTMTLRAANRLLKTIEEPSYGTVIFLLSENICALPQTIRSRCIHVRLDEKDAMPVEGTEEICENIINMILDGEYFYKIKDVIEKTCSTSEETLIILDGMEKMYMDILLRKKGEYRRFSKEYIFRAIRYIEDARREIQLKLNYKYAMKKMILNIGG